jgi:hypothetical protein
MIMAFFLSLFRGRTGEERFHETRLQIPQDGKFDG